MISRADALRHVLERVAPLSPVEVEVASAAGLVLAEDVTASRPVPPFANTAMDGIAVRAADTHHGAVLRLVGTVAAGDSGAIEVGPGRVLCGLIKRIAPTLALHSFAEPAGLLELGALAKTS